ncbi:MAG TPA: TfoX/Sxy family protein [Gemmatales bacterium]|nr:TfoX/Sxy family protein [Gemmatales bacterium]
MPYSQSLAHRLRDCLDRYPHILEKKMFGGLGFLLNGNMLIGVWKEYLVLRLGVAQATEALKQEHVKAFDVTGKPLSGWVMIAEDDIDDDLDLKQWLSQAMEFVGTLPGK